jgi:hypothetical protein
MSNSYGSQRDPNLRASDADRDQVAETLRNHHTEGRLDSEEMQQRIDACYSAKTVGDLEALLHDLPRQNPRTPPRQGRGNRFPFGLGLGLGLGFGRRRMLRLWPIAIALIVLSIVTGHHFLWVAIPAFFLATRLLAPRCRRLRARAGGEWA